MAGDSARRPVERRAGPRAMNARYADTQTYKSNRPDSPTVPHTSHRAEVGSASRGSHRRQTRACGRRWPSGPVAADRVARVRPGTTGDHRRVLTWANQRVRVSGPCGGTPSTSGFVHLGTGPLRRPGRRWSRRTPPRAAHHGAQRRHPAETGTEGPLQSRWGCRDRPRSDDVSGSRPRPLGLRVRPFRRCVRPPGPARCRRSCPPGLRPVRACRPPGGCRARRCRSARRRPPRGAGSSSRRRHSPT